MSSMFPLQLKMKDLRREQPHPGLLVERDAETEAHYGKGNHFITKAASGYRLAIITEPGTIGPPGYLGKPGFLRWCRSMPGDGMRCSDRGVWVFDDNTSRTQIYDRDEPVFEVTTEGTP